MIAGFFRELRRRRVYQTIAFYVVGAWLIIQIADVLFPAWNIPEAAKQYLVIAAFFGFPIAVLFGWHFDITAKGIQKTPTANAGTKQSLPLQKPDVGLLSILGVASAVLLYWMISHVGELAITPELADAPSNVLENSIAVLPFLNISNDPDNEYFCDGVSEELLLKLGDYRDLHVLARTSSFPFKGSDLGVSKLARILGVRYVLQGSVRKDADQLRITAQLIDNTGFQLWSESYDRELTSIFAIQREIAAAVAGNLASLISGAPVERRTDTPSIEAYQYFLHGREHFRRRSANWTTVSIEYYEKAIEADPNFPQPYAMLAVSMLIGRGGVDHAKMLEEAQVLIDRALDLNPELPEAYAAQGLLHTGHPADYVAAEKALRRALDLDPNTPGARNWLVIALGSQDKFEEAFAERVRALELDPLDITLNMNVGLGYSSRGDFRRAEAQMKRMLDIPGSDRTVYGNLHSLYEAYGHYVDMLDANKKRSILLAEVSGKPTAFYLPIVYARVGMWDTSLYWQAYQEQLNENNLGTLFRRGLIYKLRGEYELMWQHMSDVFRTHNMDESNLPFWAAQVFGGVHALSGRYEDGIEYLENVVDTTKPMPTHLGGGAFGLDFANTLAWAHQKAGNVERANEVLEFTLKQVRRWEDLDGGRSPDALLEKAMALMLADDVDRAMETLQLAVATGWRDYYMVWNDPRWDKVREDPRFLSMMLEVKADVDAMAAQMAMINADDNFEERLKTAAASAETESQQQ